MPALIGILYSPQHPSALYRMNNPDTRISISRLFQDGEGQDWSIELLRGMAALMVVFAHYWQMVFTRNPGIFGFAFSGVHLFFVISGFIFTPYLFGRRLEIKPYFVRRLFRIYPLYLFALSIYMLIHIYQGTGIHYVWQHLLFLQTISSYQIGGFYNLTFWSLCPEVEFYLLLPCLALYVKDLPSLARVFLLALGLHLLVAWRFPAHSDMITPALVASYHLPNMLIEFLIGSLCWYVSQDKRPPRLRIALLLAGCLMWLGLAIWFDRDYAHGGNDGVAADTLLFLHLGLLSAVAYALITAAWVGWMTSPPIWFKKTAMCMGNISYGVYLLHGAAPVVLQRWQSQFSGRGFAIACTILTIAVSLVAHVLLEAPLRSVGRALAARLGARRATISTV